MSWKELKPMKRVLIIGANSYIGKKFYEHVYSLNDKLMDVDMVSAADGSWQKVDFSKYDSVLHLSAIVHRREKRSMKELYFEVNHKLAVDVAKQAKAKGVKHFIFMSTAAVYGNRSGGITKATLPHPDTYYGISKLAAEEDILKLQEENFKISILRPPMVYGEGCRGNYVRLIKAARYLCVFPNHHNKRSVISIFKLSQDLVQIIKEEGAGIYLLQDEGYMDTCNLFIKEREKLGKRTFMLPGYLITPLLNQINLLRKIFGDFYYITEVENNGALKG